VSAVELSGGPPKPGLVNVANALTVLRLMLVPVFIAICLYLLPPSLSPPPSSSRLPWPRPSW
jgi:phosphatidylglycerophosphate synthase